MISSPHAAAIRLPRDRSAKFVDFAVGASFAWANWTTLREMVGRWEGDPRYAHGYLVPVFAAVLLWLRRGQIAATALRPSWWGLPILVTSVGLRLGAAHFFIEWFDGLSLLLSLAGIAVLLGGWPALRWSWPAIGFLFFMIPLPFRIEVGLGQPLQRLATKLSTFAIQMTGLHATSEGNVIVLDDDIRIGVVEACSGLSMLFTFFAISTGLAIVIRRPMMDKVLIILGAIPIAIIANITRITVTAILHEVVGSRLANLVFHDLAGWLMMPLAMGLLMVELRMLSRLFVAPDAGRSEPRTMMDEAAALGYRGGGSASNAGPSAKRGPRGPVRE